MTKTYSFLEKFIEGEVKSGFWTTSTYLIVSLSSFFIVYFLSVYEYGLYQLIISAIAIAEGLTAGFIDDVVFSDLSRYLGEKKNNLAKKMFKEYALLRIFTSFILAIIMFFLSNIIAEYYGEDISFYITMMAFVLPFMTAISVMNLFFRANLYFSYIRFSFFGELLKLALILVLWFFQGLGITQIILAYIIGQILSFLFSGYFFTKLFNGLKVSILNNKNNDDVSVIKLIRSYGFWIFLRFFFAKVSASVKSFLIKFFAGTEALGLFSLARNIIAVLLRLLPVGTFGDLFPREIQDKERARFLFVRILKYSMYSALIFSIFCFLIVPLIINNFLYKYESSLLLFKIMVPIIFLYGIYKIIRIVLITFKEQKILAVRSFDNSFLSPLLLVFLLPIFGINGAAIEWLITYLITTLFFMYGLLKKHEYLSFSIRELFVFDKMDKSLILKSGLLLKKHIFKSKN